MMEPIYVRLTDSEFEKIKKLNVGDRFTHVNLLHKKTQLHLDGRDLQLGVRILKSGSVGERVVNPELDLENLISLKLLSLDYPFEISKVNNHSNLILHNDIGIFESLKEKYLHVLGIDEQTLMNMQYYTREFLIIEK
ncbi:hypothetical protein HYV12_03255 [Candidatus Dojkabacteria bacterium]|nr:hypothetical protein [Candidatus Dojkabacteria bacterium]